MVKWANMENDHGTRKGIPFNKWKDEKNVNKHRDTLETVSNEILSNPEYNAKTKLLAKNIKRTIEKIPPLD
jgi:hypothetical protein